MRKGFFCFSEVANVGLLFSFLLCFSGCKGMSMVEKNETRSALLQLRDSLNYPNGSSLISDWVGNDYCAWSRITCGSNSSNVVVIDLFSARETRLGIWYPNATIISQFKELESLDLRYNNIGGWVMPEALCGLRNLKILGLSGNPLNDDGLPRLETCGLTSSLENLYLSDVYPSFPLLTALCGFKNLRTLGLSYNNLSDKNVPPCLLRNLSSLESLYLSGNYLKGSHGILTALCGFKNLRTLDLSDNNLSDKNVPPCLLRNLSSLESLDLSRNYLKGSHGILTALCGLRNLKTLDLSGNPLNDDGLPRLETCGIASSLETLYLSKVYPSFPLLTALCGFKNLRTLDLSYNNLSDKNVPPCLLRNLSSLESLYLSRNYLKGSHGILTGICELGNLQELYLEINSFQGGIHPCFGNLTSLQTLILSDNTFDGILSFSMFANLSKLQTIDLSNNALEVETESPTWIPSFQLSSLYLINCKLNKRSGHIIPSFLSNQHELTDVDLSCNFLQGIVPSWLLYNRTTEILSLRGNSLSGRFPVSSQIQASSLLILDISDNHIDGQLPRNIDKQFPQLYYLNMSINLFEGTIPSSFGNISELQVLDLSYNFLQGKIPQSLTQNNPLLVQLILSNNNFHGEIMPRFSNMTYLYHLNLQNSGFTGTIAAGMVNMPNLMILDVSGNHLSSNIPNWFPTLPNLVALILARNLFHGHIPMSLCQMQSLHILDISSNRLSGVLPSCLNNITAWKKEAELSPLLSSMRGYSRYTNSLVKVPFPTKGNLLFFEGIPLSLMTGIDLSVNQLSGEIPSQMGELIMLRSINFSYNVLTSHFPESFQNLKNLESLDLSHNHLVGTLPPQIVQLHFLSTFSVAFNNLSGRIPFEQNFGTFNETSYMGNSGLFGLPLKENCSFENPPQQHDGHGKEEEPRITDSDLFFFSCVAICYALGFWAVIAPLIINKNWRRRYYKVVDSYIDLCREKLFGFWFHVKNCHRN